MKSPRLLPAASRGIAVLGLALVCSCERTTAKRNEPVRTDSTATWSLASAARPYAGTTLRLIGEDYPPLHAIDSVSKIFEAETGISVEVEGYEAEQAIQRITLDIASGAGRYDMVAQVYFDMGRLVSRDQVLPLTNFLSDPALRDPSFSPENDLFPVWRTMGWYDGVPYGFPMMVLTMYTWYRKDLFEDPAEKTRFQARYGRELQPARNWDEYEDIAEFFHRPNQGLYGTLIQGRRHIALWQEYINFLYSFGGAILDTDDPSKYGDIVINSPQAVAATEYYKGLLRYSPPDALSYTWDDALALTQQGRVAQLIMWNDALYSLEDPEQSRVAGKMGYTMIPAGPNGSLHEIGGQSLYIPRTSKNPRAAYLFMQWLMAREPQIRQQLLGGSSPRPTTYQDPNVLNLPWTRTTLDAFGHTHPAMLYTFPESMQIGDVLQIAISDALAGRKAVRAALDWAAMEIKRILGDKANLRYPPQQN